MSDELSKETTEAQAPAQGEAATADAQPVSEKPVESKPDEQKAAEPVKSILEEEDGEKSPAQSKAPEAYDEFKMPEGVQADAGALESFKPLAKDMGLSQEQAQKLVDLYAKGVVETAQAQAKAWDKTVEGWTTALKSDSEFGGTNLGANRGLAVSALNQFGSPELRQYLETTRLANHPEMFKMLARVGKAISEDKLLDGGPSKSDIPLAQRMFPSMSKI